MNWLRLRRMLLAVVLLLVMLSGLWLVVANRGQNITLNLLWMTLPATNAGVVVLLSFVAGALLGLLAALLIFRVVPLRWQLRQQRQQVEALRKLNARPPVP